MKVVILCGGEGTRLRDASEILPKPMVPIGEHPIVWHIMKYYASFGYKKFVLCLGYKSEAFIDYFLNYKTRNSDMTLTLGEEAKIQIHHKHAEQDWEITLANTGINTMTGCRLFRVRQYLTEENFLLTYGDGLSSIDIQKEVAFHQKHGNWVTMSAVHPSGRFGEMDLDGDKVACFNEKPQINLGYINGGFMVMKRAFIDKYLKEDPMMALEREPLMQASVDGRVSAFRHDGFWQCMDTPREHKLLDQLWATGEAPWKRW